MGKRGAAPSRRQCSGVDAGFLYLEREEIPLNVGAVCVFDGPVSLENLLRNIDSKLHLIPRYRQVIAAPPLDLGYPVWQDDSSFDIRHHIFKARLPALAARRSWRRSPASALARSWTARSRCGTSAWSRA